MTQHAVIYLLCALGVFQKGLAAVIETQQTVMAAVGEEALLNCQLMQPKDGVQMKWLKVLPKGVENLAFSSKDSAGQVNPDFRDKVEFKYAGPQCCSIVIKNVTEEDEGCYRCVLYTDPDRPLTATTCLQLYGVDEESGSDNSDLNVTLITVLVVVSCVCVAAAVIIILPKRKNCDRLSHRDSDENKTPRRTTKDTEEDGTLVAMQDIQQVRRRTPPEKNQTRDQPTPPSPANVFQYVRQTVVAELRL